MVTILNALLYKTTQHQNPKTAIQICKLYLLSTLCSGILAIFYMSLIYRKVHLLILSTSYSLALCLYCRVEMVPRKGCAKVQMMGIFVGAKVVRGPDWDWSNQDGGEGNQIHSNSCHDNKIVTLYSKTKKTEKY